MAAIGNPTNEERYQLFIDNITLQSLETLVNNNAQVIDEHDNNSNYENYNNNENAMIIDNDNDDNAMNTDRYVRPEPEISLFSNTTKDFYIDELLNRNLRPIIGRLQKPPTPSNLIDLGRGIVNCKFLMNYLLSELIENPEIRQTLIDSNLLVVDVNKYDNKKQARLTDEYILKNNDFKTFFRYNDRNTGNEHDDEYNFNQFFEMLNIPYNQNYNRDVTQIPNGYDDNLKIIYIKFVFILYISNLIVLIEQYIQNNSPPPPNQNANPAGQPQSPPPPPQTIGGKKSKKQRKSKK